MDLILQLCVERINNVWNAAPPTGYTAAGPAPEYKTFQKVTETLAGLERKRLLDVISENRGVEQGNRREMNKKQLKFIEFSIDPSVKRQRHVRQLLEVLQLDPNAESYFLTTAQTYEKGRTLTLVTRPLAATMSYLSMGIIPPSVDINKGIVHLPTDEDGNTLDWHPATEGIFSVKSSNVKPDDAYVTVQYRNSWFYISDNDLISKNTLSMFEILLALRAGETPENRTPLTIPIR